MEEKKDFNTIIGHNLLQLRKNKKLTQMELAEQFNYSDKSVSKWEKGESLPSIDVLCELAEFYGVNLDYLTSEAPTEINKTQVQEKKKKKKKIKTPRMFPAHLVITLLSVGAVWLFATILFVLLKIFANVNYYMAFMWAGVASCIVLIVFNSIWGRMRYLFPILTVLLWLALVSLHIQIYVTTGHNIWPIYFLGIPLQVLIVLWGALIKKPRGYYKKLKEQTSQEKQETKE